MRKGLKEGLTLHQKFAEGIIYRGIGGVIYFPGGCPVVCFSDEKSNLTGIMHIGWRSIGADIIDNFLNLWEIHGGHKGSATKIQILPAMCGKCLNFPIEYYSNSIAPAIMHTFPKKIISQFTKNIEERIELELIGLIQFALKQRGYIPKRAHECTCCSGKYWCYLCCDKNGKKYRNAAFIMKAPFIIPPPFAF